MEFNQRSTPTDPSNIQCRVCSEATSECYPISWYKPVW